MNTKNIMKIVKKFNKFVRIVKKNLKENKLNLTQKFSVSIIISYKKKKE